MDFDSLGWMENIDYAKHLGINVHTVTFDDSKWKVEELLADLEKCFTGIKCTKCNENDASYVHIENKTYYCEADSMYIDKLDKNVKEFNKVKDDLKEVIIKIEKYNLMVQERTHLLIQEKLVLINEECEFNEKTRVLERNLDFFKSDIRKLKDKWNLEFFLELAHSFDKIKEIVMDIIKIAAELLAELDLEKLYRTVKQGIENDLSNMDSKEEVKVHRNKPHSKSELYHKPLDILNPQYISAVILK